VVSERPVGLRSASRAAPSEQEVQPAQAALELQAAAVAQRPAPRVALRAAAAQPAEGLAAEP